MSLGAIEPLGDNLLSLTLPFPVKGWSTKDSIAVMDPLHAIELQNLFPDRGAGKLRKGYRYHAKSIGSGAVIALATLETNAISKLVAIGSNNTVYDATTASAAATSIQGAVSTALPFYYFQQFRDNLLVSSGSGATVDSVYRWTGTGNLQGVTFTSTLAGGATRGLGPMAVYKKRIYFLQVADASGAVGTSVWYSPEDTNGSTGTPALTEFPFLSVLDLGGQAVFIGKVTRAKDFSEDELFCIITNQGEVLIYQGNNPASATWGLIGHYFIPRPLGARAFFYIGPDLQIITRQGVISIQGVMAGQKTAVKYETISDPIDEAISDAATDALLNDPYWVGINYPKGNYALVNVPITSGSVSHQYIVNTSSGAWCKFTNQNAFCWTLFQDRLYFGGLSGRVFKADNGDFDEDPASEGNAVVTPVKMRQAYNYLGKPGKKKQIHFIRPVIEQDDGLNVTMGVNMDYEDTVTTNNPVDSSDTAYKLYQPLIKVVGLGKAVSIRQDQSMSNMTYKHYATEILYSEGGLK